MTRTQKPMPRHVTEYRTLQEEIRNKRRRAKEELLNKNCAEIETMSITEEAVRYKN